MAQLQADALALPLGEPSTALHALRRQVYRSAHLRLFDKLGFGGQGPQQVRYGRWARGTAAPGPLDQ